MFFEKPVGVIFELSGVVADLGCINFGLCFTTGCGVVVSVLSLRQSTQHTPLRGGFYVADGFGGFWARAPGSKAGTAWQESCPACSGGSRAGAARGWWLGPDVSSKSHPCEAQTYPPPGGSGSAAALRNSVLLWVMNSVPGSGRQVEVTSVGAVGREIRTHTAVHLTAVGYGEEEGSGLCALGSPRMSCPGETQHPPAVLSPGCHPKCLESGISPPDLCLQPTH